MIHRRVLIITLACLTALTGDLTAVARPFFSHNQRPMVSAQTGALAILNNQTITIDDIDPNIREASNSLESEIAAIRKRVLAEEIDSLLFEAEAKRRRISLSRLMALEVTGRAVVPTNEEIQVVYAANRVQFGTADLNKARPQIVDYLRRESVQKLITDLATRLRKRFAVVMGADINSPKLASTATLATVAGSVITAGPILERLNPIIYDMRLRVYEAIKVAVNQLIYNLLILDEARRRGVDPEVIIRKEITEKYRVPTEDAIAKYFEENKARVNGDLAAMHDAIATYLEEQERTKLEHALGDRLREGAKIRILLVEPEPLVLAVSIDDDPSRGSANAPVTVVVFTDFQCPTCGFYHPIIDQVAKSYENSLRLVIRDFPLEMHENAYKAAEAANAAFAQGKFFEYEALLFKNQNALDTASLKKYATALGLNRARFDAALDSGAYKAEVDHDIADGQRYGIIATPTVYVNGVRVNNLSAETLRAAIDRALARKVAGPSASSTGIKK